MTHHARRGYVKLSFLFLFLALTGVAACDQNRNAGTGEGAVLDIAKAGRMGPGLAGTLKDEASRPLARRQVAACMSTVCLFGETDSSGDFFFTIEPPADVALKTPEDLSIMPRRDVALWPVRIVDKSLVDVGNVYVPTLPEGVPIGPVDKDPQTLSVGDGLELTLRRTDLTPQPGETLVDVAARVIPTEQTRPLLALINETIVAVYALHPFAAQSRSPIAVRAASSLPARTRVNFRTISEIDGHFSMPVPGQADGTSVVTEPSAGIVELTWLVISLPATPDTANGG